MKKQNMVASTENLPAERMQREAEKYGRLPHPEMAAHPVQRISYPSYGGFDRPINEPNG